ncbi:MAG: SPOR domain-containing protein [Ramlibacter sp.]|nr:SPOR domain-containing protein [Ramlibacter sp.]
MPFFKFRKSGDEPAATQQPAESVEAMRKRALHRLIGAVLLVVIGVVGFPLLFDTQPRPIAVDIPIEIPDRNKAKPLVVPAQVAASAPAAAQVASSAPAPVAVAAAPVAPRDEAPAASAAPKAELAPEPRPEPKIAAVKPETKPEPKPELKAEAAKPEPKAESVKPPARTDDGAKARALLEGKAPEAAANGRFVVQVGAFADAALARETRQKLERAGLKTYTHVADTKDGKRTRVRVGPFASKDEAGKAAEKIKGLDLPAAVLTL